ncbi:hypothetical protein M3J09_007550 [Ascochyta lentis]
MQIRSLTRSLNDPCNAGQFHPILRSHVACAASMGLHRRNERKRREAVQERDRKADAEQVSYWKA